MAGYRVHCALHLRSDVVIWYPLLQRFKELQLHANPTPSPLGDTDGFRSGSGRMYQGGDGEMPGNGLELVSVDLTCLLRGDERWMVAGFPL